MHVSLKQLQMDFKQCIIEEYKTEGNCLFIFHNW